MRSPFGPRAESSWGLALLVLIGGLVLAFAPLAQATAQVHHAHRYIGADCGLDRFPATSPGGRDSVGARLPRRAGTDADSFGYHDDVRVHGGPAEMPMALERLGQHSASASSCDEPSALITARSWAAIASRAPPAA